MRAKWMKLLNLFSEKTKYTLLLRMFTLTKVPLLFFVRASVHQLDDKICTIKIPFKRRNKNHLNSMFVGVLTTGADCAGLLAGIHKTQLKGLNVAFAVKDMQVNFLRRAEGDTYFTCEQGLEIDSYVQEAIRTGERLNKPIKVTATCPDTTGSEPVAEFTLTLSLKNKSLKDKSNRH
jgi:acyl-coenzyme A thioesterase PaaI-like protein